MEAEEERKRREAEEEERKRIEEIERNFDREGELKRLGGRVFDFFVDDGKHKVWISISRHKEELALRVATAHILQEP